MNSKALSILVVAILSAGLIAALLPSYLENRQKERDASLDCQMYRVDVRLYGRFSEEAEKTRKRGGCSPI
jgi:type II secretory pathway pseudopilin PulG